MERDFEGGFAGGKGGSGVIEALAMRETEREGEYGKREKTNMRS